jgi:hypothetical protein
MIHDHIIEEIQGGRLDGEFIRPAYGSYSIAEIVPSILRWLGVPTERSALPRAIMERFESPRRILFLLVDGFAFEHFVRYAPSSAILRRMAEHADVYPLTSVFPSTTPAALTTLHTGLTPQEHGLPEWTVFFDEIDEIIETLPFRVLLKGGRDTVLDLAQASEMLYHGPTAYELLGAASIPSWVFVHASYAFSAYSRATQKGATVVPYMNGLELMRSLVDQLESHDGPGYFFVYWGDIDAAMHRFGPHSSEHLTELAFLSEALEHELFAKLSKKTATDTLFMMSADHGHTTVRTDRIIYLNAFEDLEACYRKTKGGKTIAPTGGPHDVFLFLEPEKKKQAIEIASRALGDRARILDTEEAIQRGLFGVGAPIKKFLRRVGDVLILPRNDHVVWYQHSPNKPFTQLGCHGGLWAEEMIVPLVLAPIEHLSPISSSATR